MATELKKGSNVISANGDYFWQVRPYQPATVKINFTTAGSGGTVALKDSQGDPYLDKNDAAISVAYNDAAGEGANVHPTGGRINFTAASFAGGAVASIRVFQEPND